MSLAQRLWSSTGSADRPMIFTFRLSNSAFMRAIVPSSVVQTGVKSFGCEKSTAHLSPIHWWNSIWPSVVCALKLGAVSPIRNAMTVSCAGELSILALAAEVNYRQHHGSRLQRGAEEEWRADAPIPRRQMGHHGKQRRADGRGNHRGQAVQPAHRAERLALRARIGRARDDALDRRGDGRAEQVDEDHREHHPALRGRAP